ncbi:MAG: hypothetical protein NUW24_01710 [Anaerolineae bacterium]|nr:hypothetical protein [Anaerolineae bacterium]
MMVQQTPVLTDEELLDILETRLPDLLDRHPELQRRAYAAFMTVFARREEVAAIMAELREFRQETAQRFEQIDQRFEQIDQRFEQIDQRFEEVDQRFEQMSKHFEDLQDWVELVVGRLQVRSGRNLEDVVAAALRLALKRPDIRPESIRLRQKIVDAEGWVFPRGRQKEVDLVATDDEYLVFEVKSAAEVDDVDYFADKVELVRLLNPDKTVRGVFITLAPEPDVRQRCQELGIELAR